MRSMSHKHEDSSHSHHHRHNLHRAHEVEKAKPEDSIFAKVVGGGVPVKVVFEDDLVMAFHDNNPQAPTHILVIPKTPIGGPSDFQVGDLKQKELLGHLLQVGAEVARKEGICDHGYRMVMNEGKDGGQTVRWLHLHIIGGRPMTWPPG